MYSINDRLPPSEALLNGMERYLVTVVCALFYLARCTIYLPFLMIVFLSAEELIVVCGDTLYKRVEIKMMVLHSYNVKFESGESSWQVHKKLATI